MESEKVLVKNPFEEIRIKKNKFKGKEYLDIRTYYKKNENDASSDAVPSKKGVTIPIKLLSEFKEIISNL